MVTCEVDFVVYELDQKFTHLWNPLFVVEGVKAGLGIDLLVVEAPFY